MIRNIIFDFGGILIDIDYGQTDINLGRYFGLSKINVPPLQAIMEDYEIGNFDEPTFITRLKQHCVSTAESQELINAWNSMLGDLPIHRLEMVRVLSKDYRVFLLSNTNYTHITFVRNLVEQEYGILDFEKKYFEKVYYSHEINLRKPNRDIYDYVLKDAEIDSSESLFIDDSKLNVEGARKAGMNSVVHNPEVDITEAIGQYLIFDI